MLTEINTMLRGIITKDVKAVLGYLFKNVWRDLETL